MLSASRSRVKFELQKYPRDEQRLVVNILCFSDMYVIVGSIHELGPARIQAQRVDAPIDGIYVTNDQLDALVNGVRVNARDMRPVNAERYLEFEWNLGYVHCCLTNVNHVFELNNNRFCLVLVSAQIERQRVEYTNREDSNTGRINSHINLFITVTRHCAGYYYNIM